VLTSTFQHLPGISPRKERELWNAGTMTWSDYMSSFRQPDLFGAEAIPVLRDSLSAWRQGDVGYFAARLPRPLHYRLALAFPHDSIFLDIETTGLSHYYHHLTLVGWSSRGRYSVFFAGGEPRELLESLSAAKVIITFNGTLFDIPFLRRSFPGALLPEVHVDLRFLARRVGLRGGQKSIEREIGFTRPAVVQGQDGELAPVLWHRFQRGDSAALRQLVAYNLADVQGMKAILDEVSDRLQAAGELPANIALPHFTRCPPNADQDAVLSALRLPQPLIAAQYATYSSVFPSQRISTLRVLGIDLVAAQTKGSGWALLEDGRAITGVLRSDVEIMELVARTRPELVSIDAPLSMPEGRLEVEDSDPGRERYGIIRTCEKVLFRRGVRVYPALIRSMQGLTKRGMLLAAALRRTGVPVIESFPGAAQDILQIPRKREGLDLVKQGLADFGIKGDFLKGAVTHDEVDAVTCALVGLFFWCGRYEAIGNKKEDYLIVPDLDVSPPFRFVIGVSGPIAAGKTTISRYIESKNFFYARFSEIIDDLLCQANLPTDRLHRQTMGDQVNRSPGQRWLCQTLIERIPDQASCIVVDGLRFPDDHAFFVERFGSQFLHLHVTAARDTRETRYIRSGLTTNDFVMAEVARTEQHHRQMGLLAGAMVDNQSDLPHLWKHVDRIVEAVRIRLGAR
jgi:uncharacterized protein YprB with RNaseH-like and TPR domain/predicted nuclease with RNAse H fold/dephospho-CoA kinase